MATTEPAAPAAVRGTDEESGEPDESRPRSSVQEKTIVIEQGGEASNTPSLVEAAKAERERRRESAGSALVITDENLQEKAAGGRLTEARPRRHDPKDPKDPNDPKDPKDAEEGRAEPPASDDASAEVYWRARVLEARLTWRSLVDEISGLEGEVNLLRRRFYEEDDPYYRDSQIKPAWDRALDRLREARELAQDARKLVDETLEAGRRRGALPGWLREGLNLEPERERQREHQPGDLEEHRPGEPRIYKPGSDGADGDAGDGGNRG